MMKQVVSTVIVIVSLCLAALVGTETLKMKFYIGLIVVEYMIILCLNEEFRKAIRKRFGRKAVFGSEAMHYKAVHLEAFQEEIDRMTEYEFKYFIKDVLEHLGYKIKPIKASRIFEMDFIAQKDKKSVLIKLKHEDKSVDEKSKEKSEEDEKLIMQVIASRPIYKTTESMILVNGSFSERAYQLAQYHPVRLINGKQLYALTKKVISKEHCQEQPKKEKGVKQSHNEDECITKADCLCEHLESVLTDTITEVTLEDRTSSENQCPHIHSKTGNK